MPLVPAAKKDPLDEAFAALATYDWGQDPKALQARSFVFTQ